MSSKLVPIDFEYKSFQNDKFLIPICVAVGDNVYWLLDEIQKNNFIEYMKSIEGDTLISHASSLAEIPCCLQLGIDVEKYLWFDTMVMQKRLDGIMTRWIERKTIACWIAWKLMALSTR